jgi:hypothetical protein
MGCSPSLNPASGPSRRTAATGRLRPALLSVCSPRLRAAMQALSAQIPSRRGVKTRHRHTPPDALRAQAESAPVPARGAVRGVFSVPRPRYRCQRSRRPRLEVAESLFNVAGTPEPPPTGPLRRKAAAPTYAPHQPGRRCRLGAQNTLTPRLENPSLTHSARCSPDPGAENGSSAPLDLGPLHLGRRRVGKAPARRALSSPEKAGNLGNSVWAIAEWNWLPGEAWRRPEFARVLRLSHHPLRRGTLAV